MRPSITLTAARLALAGVFALMAMPAHAACKRLGFSVNDYGKDGPTKDAKELLDKHIAKKMADQGVKTYTTGKKDVKCELFLNFIVFDEHTCTAEATVCWDGSVLPKSQQVDAKADTAAAKPSAKPAEAPEAKATETKSTETKSTETKPPETKPTETKTEPAPAVETAAEKAKDPAPQAAAAKATPASGDAAKVVENPADAEAYPVPQAPNPDTP